MSQTLRNNYFKIYMFLNFVLAKIFHTLQMIKIYFLTLNNLQNKFQSIYAKEFCLCYFLTIKSI